MLKWKFIAPLNICLILTRAFAMSGCLSHTCHCYCYCHCHCQRCRMLLVSSLFAVFLIHFNAFIIRCKHWNIWLKCSSNYLYILQLVNWMRSFRSDHIRERFQFWHLEPLFLSLHQINRTVCHMHCVCLCSFDTCKGSKFYWRKKQQQQQQHQSSSVRAFDMHGFDRILVSLVCPPTTWSKFRWIVINMQINDSGP